MRRYEIEHAVDAVVRDVFAVEAALVLEVLLVSAVDVLLDGAPTKITQKTVYNSPVLKTNIDKCQ